MYGNNKKKHQIKKAQRNKLERIDTVIVTNNRREKIVHVFRFMSFIPKGSVWCVWTDWIYLICAVL